MDDSATDFGRLSFSAAWFARATVRRALRVSAIVGTVLVLIIQCDLLLEGGRPPLWKVLLTYCVPYAVSSWSSAAALVEMHSARSGQPRA